MPHPPHLRRQILLRILPIATLLVLANSFFTYRSVSRQVHQQIVDRVIASADHSAKEIHQQLTLVTEACAAISSNDLVINGIIDLDHRHSTLQSFVGSLELPGARMRNVAMTNYRGDPIAIKFDDRDEFLVSRPKWLPVVMSGRDYAGVTNDLLIIASPINYGNRPEGAIVSTYAAKDFFSGFTVNTARTVTAISLNDRYFYSTHDSGVPVSTHIEEWFTASSPVANMPGLKVTTFESRKAGSNPVYIVRNALIASTILICAALVGSIWLASMMAVRPVREFADAVDQVRETRDLSLSVHENSTAEFSQLSTQFNAMLRELETTTVSKEQFRKLALVAKYTDNAVVITNAQGEIEWVNEGFMRITEYSEEEVIGRRPAEFLQGEQTDPEAVRIMREGIRSLEGFDVEIVNYNKSGNPYWVAIEVRPIRDEAGIVNNFIAIESDISERKKAEQEKERLGKELQKAAHHAGMAEMATGVLHNIGNVLNSINISVRVLQESIQSSSVTRLPLLVKMLNEHEDDLGDFLSENPQGRKLVPYLNKLTHAITLEKDAFGDEVQCLLGNIDVVAQIIASQQSLAQKGGFQELVDLQALLENVLKMQSHGLDKYRIRIKRQYQDVPSVMAEKHKLLQVVVNLVSNAKQALRDCDKEDRELTVGLAPDQDSIRITVEDNGVGISEDDFEQIFSHGFTTKTDGHGFGLHSSALAAHEIGGSLSAHSDGVGLGAKFTLRLPVTADELIAEASM